MAPRRGAAARTFFPAQSTRKASPPAHVGASCCQLCILAAKLRVKHNFGVGEAVLEVSSPARQAGAGSGERPAAQAGDGRQVEEAGLAVGPPYEPAVLFHQKRIQRGCNPACRFRARRELLHTPTCNLPCSALHWIPGAVQRLKNRAERRGRLNGQLAAIVLILSRSTVITHVPRAPAPLDLWRLSLAFHSQLLRVKKRYPGVVAAARLETLRLAGLG